MDANLLWDKAGDPEKSERYIEGTRRRFAGRPSRASAPTGALKLGHRTALDTDLMPQWLLVGASGQVIAGTNTKESGKQYREEESLWFQLVGRLGVPRGPRLHAGLPLALARGGMHLLVTSSWAGIPGSRRYMIQREQFLKLFRVPSGGCAGDIPVPGDDSAPVAAYPIGGGRVLITNDRPRDPHQGGWQYRVGATILQLPQLPTSDRWDEVRLVRRLGWISCNDSRVILAGLAPDGVVLCNERGIQWTDWVLRPTRSWHQACSPRAFAVGPNGHAVLAAWFDGKAMLVGFSPDGSERFRRHTPSVSAGDPNTLVVDGEGGTILSPPNELHAFGPDGTPRWALQRDSETEALALADGEAMYVDGKRLLVIGRSGKPTEVFESEARLVTAPAEHGGRWYVATAEALLKLK